MSGIRKLVVQTIFYGFLCSAVWITAYCIGIRNGSGLLSNLKYIIRSVFSPGIGGVYWFVSVYIIIMMCYTHFLSFLLGMSSKRYLILLLYMWLIWYVLGTTGNMFGQLQKGCFFFCVGGYIRNHYKKTSSFFVKLILLFIFIISWIGAGGIHYLIASSKCIGVFSDNQITIVEMIDTGFFIPVCAVLLFLIFVSFDFRCSAVNYVSSFTFGVYLFHDTPILRNIIWNQVFHVKLYYNNVFFPVVCIFIVVVVFFIGCLVDAIRKKCLEKNLIDISNKIIEYFCFRENEL